MLEFDEYRLSLSRKTEPLEQLRQSMNIEGVEKDIAEKEKLTLDPDFYNDTKESQKVLKEINLLKSKVEKYNSVYSSWEDLTALCELGDEMEDLSVLDELSGGIEAFEKALEDLRLETLLSGPYDRNNALMTIHAGAGGTEAHDWAEMLLRMYEHWAERKGFTVKLLDCLDGEEAGIKSATLSIEGENAYGYAKAENGVHRLVRISPFDSASRRHTSFASCEVIPEIDEDLNVEINADDLRVDTYRSSGAGGQHVNKTESCIRMTHLPTGIVVTCQDERSQIKNREKALKVMKSRLYDYYNSQYRKEYDENRKSQIGTGDRSERIRTYNFPQGRITDHRIGCTLHSIESFLSGNIDEMIEALQIADREAKLANENG